MEKKSILWVDDQIDLLKAHIIFLKNKGFKVTSCNNGSESIELIKNNLYDIILLDENMPGISGIETLEQIKILRPNLKVIMITKNEAEDIMEQAIGKQISDYLIKPVNPNQILLSLKKNLKTKELINEANISQYQQKFRSLSIDMMNISSWDGWLMLYHEMIFWELKLSKTNDKTMIDILINQKKEANNLFSKFVEKNYESAINDSNGPTFSHNICKRHLFPEIKDQSVVFIVIDNLRYDQWLCIEPTILEFSKKVKEYQYFSILPSSTQYARNSLFSGLMPKSIKEKYPQYWKDDHEEGGKNLHEKELLEINLKKNFKYELKSEFIKVTNPNSADKIIEQIKEKSKNDITTIVYNFVDMLSHSKTEMQIIKELASNDKAYRSLTKSWFENSPLLEIIKKSIDLNCKVIITTDHGTINVKTASKVIGDKNTSQNLRYKTGKSLTYSLKDNIAFNDPYKINLPKSSINASYIFAKEDFYLVYPNNFNYYSNFFKNTYQHGGVSFEELIIPFIVLNS